MTKPSPTLDFDENWKYIEAHKSLFGLSDPECLMVAAINAGYLSEGATFDARKSALQERLAADLQAAIAVELATIPIYLYTYYSLNRAKVTGSELTAPQQFANEAGAVIMSVAVEEMLHMSLSSNIYFALTGTPPKLYENAPGSYPAKLPNHSPSVPDGPEEALSDLIPLRGFSFDQLWRFLLIEYAHHPTDGEVSDLHAAVKAVTADPDTAIAPYLSEAGWPSDSNWHSIGQFYSFIRCLIASHYFTDNDFCASPDQQMQSYNYSPNNIDTIYPKEAFDQTLPAPREAGTCPSKPSLSAAEVAVFPNSPDSATSDKSGSLAPDTGTPQEELIPIRSRLDVMAALETICEQGEGYSATAGGKEELWDDPNSKQELSHFDKFLMLQSQLTEFAFGKETLPAWMKDEVNKQVLGQIEDGTYQKYDVADLAAGGFISNYPVNPTRAEYMSDHVATVLNDYCSGLFQYMLLMSETIYLIPPGHFDPKTQKATDNKAIDNQKYFFNVALHRSMIWVLDKIIGYMKHCEVTVGSSKTLVLSPTFDNAGFGPNGTGLGARKDAFQNLCKLGDAVYALLDDKALPTGLDSILKRATPPAGSVNLSSQLPDVSAFWDGSNPTDLSCLYGTKNGAAS